MDWILVESIDDAGTRLEALRISDGATRSLFTCERSIPLQAAVNPAGTRAVVNAAAHSSLRNQTRVRLGLVNLEQPGIGWLKASLDPKWRLGSASFDETGTRLAFEGAYDGVPISDIYVEQLKISGNSVRETMLAGAGNPRQLGCAQPCFLPGGERLLYLRKSQGDGAWEICLLDLTSAGDSAWQLEGRAPSVLSLTLTEGADVVPDVPVQYCAPINQVFWVGKARGGSRQCLRTLKLGGGAQTDLGRQHRRIEALAVAPAGELVAYSADGQLWLADVETGATVSLINDDPDASHRGILFDLEAGRLLLCTSDNDGAHLREVNLADRRVSTLLALGDRSVLGLLPMPASSNAALEAYNSDEAEAPAEPESELEAPAEPESELEVPAEPESELEAPAKPESELEVPAEPESELEVPAEPESELQVPAEPDALPEPEPLAEQASEPEPDTVAPADAEPDTAAPADAEPDTVAPAEPEPEVAAASAAAGPPPDALASDDAVVPEGLADRAQLTSAETIAQRTQRPAEVLPETPVDDADPRVDFGRWMKSVPLAADPGARLRALETLREDTAVREAARLFLGTQRRRAAGRAEAPPDLVFALAAAAHLLLVESRRDLVALCERARPAVERGRLPAAEAYFALAALSCLDGNPEPFDAAVVFTDYATLENTRAQIHTDEGEGPAARFVDAHARQFLAQLHEALDRPAPEPQPTAGRFEHAPASLLEIAAAETERQADAARESAEEAAVLEEERAQIARLEADRVEAQRQVEAAEAEANEAAEWQRIRAEAEANEAAETQKAQREAERQEAEWAAMRRAAERQAEEAREAAERELAAAQLKAEQEHAEAQRQHAQQLAEASLQQQIRDAEEEASAAGEAAERATTAAAEQIEAAERASEEAEAARSRARRLTGGFAAISLPEAVARADVAHAETEPAAPQPTQPATPQPAAPRTAAVQPAAPQPNKAALFSPLTGPLPAAPSRTPQTIRRAHPDAQADAFSPSNADYDDDPADAVGLPSGGRVPLQIPIAGALAVVGGICQAIISVNLGSLLLPMGLLLLLGGVALFSDRRRGWQVGLAAYAINVPWIFFFAAEDVFPEWLPGELLWFAGLVGTVLLVSLLHPGLARRYRRASTGL